MKSFEYTVKDPVGIHARPAGMLSREGKKYKSAICVVKGGKSANILRLMALMGLASSAARPSPSPSRVRTRKSLAPASRLSWKPICNDIP